MSEHVYDTLRRLRVPCLITREQADALYQMAQLAAPDTAIVEIGSYKGASAICLAKGSLAGAGNRVYCIDPWARQAHTVMPERLFVDAWEHFQASIRAAGVAPLIEPWRMLSRDAATRWRAEGERRIGALFIDGEHTYEGASHDLVTFGGWCASGALIAMHDTDSPNPRYGIQQALRDVVAPLERAGRWRLFHHVPDMHMWEKLRD